MTNSIDFLIMIMIIGTAGAVLVNSMPYQKILSILHLNIKPFNCSQCIPFWIGMIILYFYGIDIPFCILGGLAASYFGDSVDKNLNKF